MQQRKNDVSDRVRTIASTGRRGLMTVAAGATMTLAIGASASAQLEDEAILRLEDLIEVLDSRGRSLDIQTFLHEEMEFDEAKFFFEENATDGDLGIQFMVDGEDWNQLRILTPDGRRLVDIRVRGSAAAIGLTEIFSESAEPSFLDLPREDFIALWPEGEYLMTGVSIEGVSLFGSATLTHDMPAQPVVDSPANDAVVNANAPFTVVWQTVPDPNSPSSVIVAYQVIVEKDEDGERLRVWTADMLPGDTSITVPAGFLEEGKAYKVEVLAEETSGNKTISEVEFETDD